MPHSKEVIIAAVRESWSHDTTASPDEWTPENVALGQCLPTSLVAQDLLGGDLELAAKHTIAIYCQTAKYLMCRATSTRKANNLYQHL